MYASVTESVDVLYNDINHRREFATLKNSEKTNTDNTFEFRAHQYFISRYVNPNTPHTRVLLKHGTGSGKTLSAIKIAEPFIAANRQVIVIGFDASKNRFKDDLIHYPELGYVEQEQIDELNRLESIAAVSHDPAIEKQAKDYKSRLMKRTKRYSFYGYQEFINKIFGINKTTTDNPEINFLLIQSFRGALIVCDEIHRTYNAYEMNNWGESIQFVLNLLGNDVYAVFMSATPLNNSNEIYDLLKLLSNPPTQMDDISIYMRMPFSQHGAIRDKVLAKTSIGHNVEHLSDSEIAQIIKGKISYLPVTGLSDMPARIIEGESITGIKYLKFIRCNMSPIHAAATHVLVDTNTNTEREMKTYYLRDIGFDLPTGITDIRTFASINSKESKEWFKERGIVPHVEIKKMTFSGEFMKRENIAKYSTKYAKLLDDIFVCKGKILIYHHRIQISGGLFIAEMLKTNGIIGEDDHENNETMCVLCHRPLGDLCHAKGRLKKHKQQGQQGLRPSDPLSPNVDLSLTTTIDAMPNENLVAIDCPFKAMRYVIIHSNIPDNITQKSLNRFNSIENTNGDKYKILIGSKKIQEGIDMKAIMYMFIMSVTSNIPSIIQVFGRAIRTGSHNNMPPENRVVRIRIYTSTYDSANHMPNGIEEENYLAKVNDYITIQHYEKILHENAIDAYIYDIEGKLNNVAIRDDLGSLPISMIPRTVELKHNTTYIALDYFRDEIATMTVILKRLLNRQRVWKLEDLWQTLIKQPGTPNPATFDKKNFAILLKGSKLSITIVGDILIYTFKAEVETYSRTKKTADIIYISNPKQFDKSAMNNDLMKSKCYDIIAFANYYERYTLLDHINLVKLIIADLVGTTFANRNNAGALSIDEQKTKKELDYKIKAYQYAFRYVTYGELKKVISYMNLPDNTIIGYKYNDRKMYVTEKLGWECVLSSDIEYNENNIIIGMYDANMKFKIREKKKTDIVDRRQAQTGAVCATRTKGFLAMICRKLQLKVDTNKMKNICDAIKEELLKREERQLNNEKWFYMMPE